MSLKDRNLTENQPSIITVVGVGGGGVNAVSNMYGQNVSFAICDDDAEVLEKSPVPTKILLGKDGVGAQAGREQAEEAIDEIRATLNNGAKIVLLAAGMGGGTGTGATPVIAKELDAIKVAIVTIPFQFEGQQRIKQAREGIIELKKYVDFLLVIDNEKLRENYGDLKIGEAFSKADSVLTSAVKCIAEQISLSGENREREAIETAMKSLRLEYKNIVVNMGNSDFLRYFGKIRNFLKRFFVYYGIVNI